MESNKVFFFVAQMSNLMIPNDGLHNPSNEGLLFPKNDGTGRGVII